MMKGCGKDSGKGGGKDMMKGSSKDRDMGSSRDMRGRGGDDRGGDRGNGYQSRGGDDRRGGGRGGDDRRAEARNHLEMINKQINSSLENAEKNVQRFLEAKEDQMARNLDVAKKSVSASQRMLEQHKGKLEPQLASEYQTRFDKCQADLDNEEKKRVEAEKAKIMAKKEELRAKADEQLAMAQASLDSFKSEYEKNKEEMEKEDTDETMDQDTRYANAEARQKMANDVMEFAKPIATALEPLKATFRECESLFRGTPSRESGIDELKAAHTEYRAKLVALERDVGVVRRQISVSAAKSKGIVAAIKKERELEVRKEEERKRAEWGAQSVERVQEFALYVEYLFSKLDPNGPSPVEECEKVRAKALGYLDVVSKIQAHENHPLSGQLIKAEISKSQNRIKKKVDVLNTWEADRKQRMEDEELQQHVAMAAQITAYMTTNELDEEAFFKQLANSKERVGLAELSLFLKSKIEVPDATLTDLVPKLFETAAHFASLVQPLPKEGEEAPAPKRDISKEEFFLHLGKVWYTCARTIAITTESEKPNDAKNRAGQAEAVDVFEVLEGPIEVAVNETRGHMLQRVKCKRTTDGQEGWVTLRAYGANAQPFLQKFNPKFCVVQETVLTDIFDLQDFKVLRRVKKE